MIEDVERTGDARKYVRTSWNAGERSWASPPASIAPTTPRRRPPRDHRRLGALRYEVALELRKAALPARGALPERKMGQRRLLRRRSCSTSRTPGEMMTPLFVSGAPPVGQPTSSEQKKTGRLIRPSSRYVGPSPRPLEDVAGYAPDPVTCVRVVPLP